jgi:hypothetical protein
MKFARRQFLHLVAGATAVPSVSHIARAQAYPMRPVRIIVGAAPSKAGARSVLPACRTHGRTTPTTGPVPGWLPGIRQWANSRLSRCKNDRWTSNSRPDIQPQLR